MMQKRSYIIPEVVVENYCTRECLMWASVSNAPNTAPKRRTAEVF
jgi:hypothetical protein